ncbi:MAG: hypothetical protein HY841_09050 [Bacteroidetes bacterium]|nr:hypothetical protein [Bacteroidota bacterium]
MKKEITFFIFLLFAGNYFSLANSASYKIDDAAIDKLFATSEDVSASVKADLYEINFSKLPSDNISRGDDTQTIAGIVALASWVMGIGWLVPIHRFILGTGGNDFKIFSLYCITISGCGFVLLIDGINLLLDDSGSKYVNNSKFIMW